MSAAAVVAAPGSATAEALTVPLEEAYSMALASHEAVKAAGEGVAQADAGVGKAISEILPTLTAEGAYTKYSESKSSGAIVTQPNDASRFDLRLSQQLYSGGMASSDRRKARLGVDRSKEALEWTRQEIVLLTAGAYYGALKAGKDLEIKRAALKRAEERRKVAEARLRVGDVTKAAVLRAEAEVASREAELKKAEGANKDALNLLKRVIGVESTAEIAPVDPPPVQSNGVDAGSIAQSAYSRRPDYRQRILEEKMAAEGVEFATGHFLPRLRAEALYSWRDQDIRTTFFQEESVSASIVLTYPLFEGGLRRAELSEARSKLREAELRRMALKKDIENEISEAANAVESARAASESYARMLAFAEENYKTVFEQFKHGLATTVDVLDADTELIAAQRAVMTSGYDHRYALLRLKSRAGTLLDEVKR